MRWVLLLPLLAALTGCTVQRDVGSVNDMGAVSATPAPSISATTTGGDAFRLDAAAGHPVVLSFWGSWCGPCRLEQADLNALEHSYSSRGVRFLGVAMRDDRAAVEAFRQAQRVAYPSVLDVDGSIAASYDIAAPPVTVVVDAKGRITGKYLATVNGVGSQLDALLKSGR